MKNRFINFTRMYLIISCLLSPLLLGMKKIVTNVSREVESKHIFFGYYKENALTSVALSSDGKKIVAGFNNNCAIIWDTESGKCLKKFDGYGNWLWRKLSGDIEGIYAVALDDFGSRLAAASDRNAIVWDTKTGKKITLRGHKQDITSVWLNLESQRLVTASAGAIKIWDLDRDSEKYGNCVVSIEGEKGFDIVAVSHDGTKIAVVIKCDRYEVRDDNIVLIDTLSRKSLLHLSEYDVRSLAFSKDDQLLAIGYYLGLSIIDVCPESKRYGKCLSNLRVDSYPIRSVAFSSDNMYVVVMSDKRVYIYICDIDAKSESYNQPVIIFDAYNNTCFKTLACDGKNIAIGFENGLVKLWSMAKLLKNKEREEFKKNDYCDYDLLFNYL